MPSVQSIKQLRSTLFLALCLASASSYAQINSPYSRYGLGDVNMSGNALNKGMGGLTSAYTDLQSVNFLNPASYSNIKWVTFDVGAEIENRTMRASNSSAAKYKSGNFAFNYITLGLPLSKKKDAGLVLGLRPASRVNYKIETTQRLNQPQSLRDSVYTIYEGTGGTYKAFVGAAYKFGNFSLGANFGYHFGQQDVSTRRIFIPDSTYTSYYKSNSGTNTSVGNIFLETGIQYQVIFKDKKSMPKYSLQIGATYNLENKLRGSRDVTRETFDYDANGGVYTVDSVFNSTKQKGTVTFPASYNVGVIFQKINSWMVGVQYDGAQWNNFTNYGEKQELKNTYLMRVGGQYIPDYTSQNVLKRISYRGGFYYGKDYINIGGNQLPTYAITLGAGIPIYHNNYALRQYLTTINLGLEFGARGNDKSVLKENFFRLHVGFSLSDLSWFHPRKYD